MRRQLSRLILPAAFSLALSAMGTAQTPLRSELIASGFSDPVQVTAPPGDRDRLFVVEQNSGRIEIVMREDGSTLGQAFLNIGDKIRPGGERGLLGMEFHPDYWNNGYFYVHYTRSSDADSIVERYQVRDGNRDKAKKSSGVVILGPVDQPFSNHNAGAIKFSPNDGYLYIAYGDGGSGGDPGCRAQKGDTFLGKMLRIDVDGGFPYIIPPTNPFISDPNVLDEIWAFGLRNPFRFAFDQETGDLYIGDVGQDAREEITWESAASLGGENHGWKIMEGNNCYGTSNCPNGIPMCNDKSLTDPIRDYGHSLGCSVTGGSVYRGCAVPDLRGTYFYGDYCSDRIWSFRWDGSTLTDFQERTTELNQGVNIDEPVAIEDVAGELFIVDHNGELFQIVADMPPPAIDLGFEKADNAGVAPKFEVCGLLHTGSEAVFSLRDAAASSLSALVIGFSNNPTPSMGGTLVPIPPAWILPLVTDPNGEIEFIVPGGGGPLDLFMQYVVVDPNAILGTTFSNALQVIFQS